MKTQEELRDTLEEIDNKGYGAYKELKGTYQVGHYTLAIDYVQGDPFASPSKVCVRLPHDVGEQAREIAEDIEVQRQKDTVKPFKMPAKRIPLTSSLEKVKGRKNHIRVKPRGLYKIQFGREDIEMRFVEQMVDHSQTNSVGQALRYAMEEVVDDERSLDEVLDQIEARIKEEGLDFLCPFDDEHPGKFAKVRKYEIAAALNRLRVFEVEQEAYEVEEI